MTRKTAESYLAVFEFVEEKLFNLEPTETITDYEEGLRLAIKTRWPNGRIKGCLWHYKRAIEKKCKSLGMHKLFKKNKRARKIKTMLTNLPLLPEHLLIDGYNSIKNFTRRNKLDRRFKEVFSYFEGYWIKQVYIHTQVSLIFFMVRIYNDKNTRLTYVCTLHPTVWILTFPIYSKNLE